MSFPVNPGKVLRMFAPLWALLALSLWLHWAEWQAMPLLFAAVGALPLAAASAAAFMRGRWRLELTPEALIHHTLGRSERFEWARMGAVEVRAGPLPSWLFVQTFWFAFPLDGARDVAERASALIGRRILAVFGDHSAAETIRQIEDWRAQIARDART